MTKITRIIKEARDQARLTALDFAQGIFDNFVELHGDRSFRDDGAVIGGIGTLNGQPVTVVGIQKGRNLQDNLRRNFGQPHPEGSAPHEAGGKIWTSCGNLYQYGRCLSWCRC